MTNLLHLFLLLLLRSGFSSGGPLYHTCGLSNYTSNSDYKSNLNQLLRILTSTNSSFTTNTTGSTPNTVYGLFLCRGDVGLSNCRACIQNATKDIGSLCPSSKKATVWYGNCELRYSNLRFFSSLNYNGSYFLANLKNVTNNVRGFIRLQKELLDDITSYTAYNSPTMFATGTAMNETNSNASFTLSGLAQCTRDLSAEDCGQCLIVARAMYTGSEASTGRRIITKSCNFRYDMYGFYQGKPDVLLNLTTPVKTWTPPLAPDTQAPVREGIYCWDSVFNSLRNFMKIR
ncbi:cysteine-rich repeat secretory protein 38-like [Asparagus officinalis]|uniref:cysteine-rich repeat secretory protein 38-like n=1 Tax=Asparagus officinalis TaxID=4686 RepID=UPI00098E2DCC|nr:cysteine-rich repeat secretory protein 38-like [Asparagus officinalis]